MKVSTEQILSAGKVVKIPTAELEALINQLAALSSKEKEKTPAVKKQFVILVSDPQGFLRGHDFAGWVLQIPDEASPVTTEERIRQAAYDFNTTKKGRLLPTQTIGEACENVPARTFKDHEIWVKTKTPVLVCVTNNELPGVEKLVSGAAETDTKQESSNIIPLPGAATEQVLTPESWDGLASEDLELPKDATDDAQGYVLRLPGIFFSSFEGERLGEEEQKLEVKTLIALSGRAETTTFREFLRINSDKIPGACAAIGYIDAALAESKAKKDKAHAFANAGTVSVPSDEGSRDDAGTENKDNP
jgi:hypothetical protein